MAWWGDKDLKISLTLNNQQSSKTVVWSLETAARVSLSFRYCKQGNTGNQDIDFVHDSHRAPR